MRVRRILSILFIALFTASAALATGLSIADARELPLGTVVTVEGAVTVPSGIYSSSTFDQGFAIQDDTAGIYVSIATNPGLQLFRRVEVTGTLDDDGFGQLVLRPADPADIEVLHGLRREAPEEVATGDVSEATEGLLVTVEGTITRGPTDDLPFGYSVFIDDGTGETQIFIPASTGINPFTIPWIQPGNKLRATGLGAQFLAQYEVLPRFRLDLRRVW